MNAEERPHGKAWVDSVRKELADYDKTVVGVSEIERVADHIRTRKHIYDADTSLIVYRELAALETIVRSLLPAQPKEPTT